MQKNRHQSRIRDLDPNSMCFYVSAFQETGVFTTERAMTFLVSHDPWVLRMSMIVLTSREGKKQLNVAGSVLDVGTSLPNKLVLTAKVSE